MYIEYISGQRISYRKKEGLWLNVTGGEYRPTWLIRTSGWSEVPGEEAIKGYCTLSYCWEQSGEVIPLGNDNYDLVDNGNHCIITKVQQEGKKKTITSHKTYEGVHRQMCIDFQIDYLWYDKVCIDQMDKEEKLREFKQMHLIYQNARYTIAVVPEVCIANPLLDFSGINKHGNPKAESIALRTVRRESKWWKRSWTLEELLMSRRVLIVGKNTHVWCQPIDHLYNQAVDFISMSMVDFARREVKSANQVLKYAHFRTSSKQHDKVFALVNIFHNIISDIDYETNIHDVMNDFYRSLIKQDLSVMCFGSVLDSRRKSKYSSTMGSYNLPSWTGVSGLHVRQPTAATTLQNTQYTIDDDMRLLIQCSYFTIHPSRYHEHYSASLGRVLQARRNSTKTYNSIDDFGGDEEAALDWSSHIMANWAACNATHFWIPEDSTFDFPVSPLSLTEDCDECIVLAVLFHSKRAKYKKDKDGTYLTVYKRGSFSPVLKKCDDSNTYKAIGTILLKQYLYHEAHCKSPYEYLEQTSNAFHNDRTEFIIT